MIQHLSRGAGHCYRKPRPRIEEQPTLHAQQPRRFAAARRDVSHETSRKEQCRPCETKRPPSRAVKGEGGLATAATVRPLPRNTSDTSRAAIQRPRREPRRLPRSSPRRPRPCLLYTSNSACASSLEKQHLGPGMNLIPKQRS